MKTTVKLDTLLSIVMEPAPDRLTVRHTVYMAGVPVRSFLATPDQIGAMQFGQDAALEAIGISADRAAS